LLTRKLVYSQWPGEGVNEMAKELRHIDISSVPELVHLVEQMLVNKEPVALQRGHEEVAVLMPPRQLRQRPRRLQPFTKDDSLWNLNGIDRSGVHDVSENVDKYLADAYLETHTAER
jgi:hypothetical protein